MPEICSRICPQERLCEGSCFLNGRSQPVSIGAIERFLIEYAIAHDAMHPVPACLTDSASRSSARVPAA